MKPLIPAVAALLLLSACATAPTLYQPATGPQGVGYSEYRIEPDRYRITFRGGPGAPARQVADYALRRAADVALAQGFDWFRVVERYSEGRPDSGPRLGVGVGGGDFGRRSGVSLGVGTSFNLGGGPSVSVTLEVLMGRGQRPREPGAYDARGVRDSLGARI